MIRALPQFKAVFGEAREEGGPVVGACSVGAPPVRAVSCSSIAAIASEKLKVAVAIRTPDQRAVRFPSGPTILRKIGGDKLESLGLAVDRGDIKESSGTPNRQCDVSCSGRVRVARNANFGRGQNFESLPSQIRCRLEVSK